MSDSLKYFLFITMPSCLCTFQVMFASTANLDTVISCQGNQSRQLDDWGIQENRNSVIHSSFEGVTVSKLVISFKTYEAGGMGGNQGLRSPGTRPGLLCYESSQLGGGGGIWTHGPLQDTRFPIVPIRPLSHSSVFIPILAMLVCSLAYAIVCSGRVLRDYTPWTESGSEGSSSQRTVLGAAGDLATAPNRVFI